MTDTNIINALDRALDMLIYMYNAGTEVSITQISEDMGVYKSTVFRTLATLEAKGFVAKNPDTEKYSLGIRLYIIGNSIGEKTGIQKLVKPYAKALHDRFNEAVNVSILERSKNDIYRSVMIYKEENHQILRFNAEVGSQNDCHCAAVGKCLLAFSENIDLSVYDNFPMTQYTEHTIITRNALEAELDKVKEQGYAVDDEERELGLTCIGAPILKNGRYAVAAISLSGPTSRIKDKNFGTKIQELIRISQEISNSLR